MPLTADRPKCLVEVGGNPILFYQLSALGACGVKEIVIVTGYRASMIEGYAAENFPHIRIQFIHNPDYLTTDKLHSWYLAKDKVMSGALIFDSDIIFHPAIISSALSLPKNVNAALYCRRQCGADETKVSVNKRGQIIDIGKNLKPVDVSGKFTGIYVFSKNFHRTFFKTVGELLNSKNPHAFGFDAIRKINGGQGLGIRGFDISKYAFAEIDSSKDLRIAEEKTVPQVISALARFK